MIGRLRCTPIMQDMQIPTLSSEIPLQPQEQWQWKRYISDRSFCNSSSIRFRSSGVGIVCLLAIAPLDGKSSQGYQGQ